MSHLVIVGGSTGIGRDIVPILEKRPCDHFVTVLPRDAPLADAATKLANACLPIGALLLCQRYRRFRSSPDAGEWQGEFDVSLTRTKRLIESAPNGCSIVVMASVAGVSVEEEQPVSYHACKAALIEMVKYYAVTLGPKSIRVNAIIPGLTIKPEARAFYDSHPELETLYKEITPLGRMGTVEDIANLVDFLISDKSAYMTGQTLTLDGGIGLRSHWALARKVTPSLRDLQVTQRKPVTA